MVSFATGRFLLLFALLLATVLVVSFVTFIADQSGAKTFSALTFSDFVDVLSIGSGTDESASDEDGTDEEEGRVLGIMDTTIGAFPPVTYSAYAASAFADPNDQFPEGSNGQDGSDGSGFGRGVFNGDVNAVFAPSGSVAFNPQLAGGEAGASGQAGNDTPAAVGVADDEANATSGGVPGTFEGAVEGRQTSAAPVIVPVVDRISPAQVVAGQALDMFGSGFDSSNEAIFTGGGTAVSLRASAGVPSWATVNIPRSMPAGTYTVTVTNRTATSAPFSVTVVAG